MTGSGLVLAGVLLCLPAQTEEKPPLLEPAKTAEALAKQRSENLLREARTFYALGIRNTREDKLLQAIKLLETARRLDPDSVEIPRVLYPLYEVLDRSEESLDLAEFVLDREPTDVTTVIEYARMASKSGQNNRALERLRKANEAKSIQDKPELAYKVLTQLASIEQQQQLWRDLANTQTQLTQLFANSRKDLLFANVLAVEDYEIVQGGLHEKLASTHLKLNNTLAALNELKKADEIYTKIANPKIRAKTGKINWHLCELYLERNDPKNALTYLDVYLQQKPDEPTPYERKAQILKTLNREREIIPFLKKVIETQPANLSLTLVYASFLSKNPLTRKEAEDLYNTLLTQNIKPEVYQGLFRLYQLDDRMTRVIDKVDDVEKSLQNEDIKPINKDRLQNQQRAMRIALRNDKELVAALLPVCLQELTRKENERKIHTWYFLAHLAQKTKQLDKAETLFRTCLREVPATLEYQVYGGLLEVLWARRKPNDVEKLCRAALDGPRPARATFPGLFHRNIARVLAERGDIEGAIKEVTKAVDISAEDAKVSSLTMRASLYAQLGKGEKAVSECEAILKDFKDAKHQRSARLALANIYSQIGKPDKSEAQLRLLLEINPDDSLALNNLGYQLADTGKRLDEAEKLLRRAIAIERASAKEADEDDVSASTLDSLGWVLFRRGKYEEARELIEKAITLSDGIDDAVLLDHLGDVYIKLGLAEKARTAWQNAVKQVDNDSRPKKEERKTQIEKKIKSVM